MGMWPFRRRSKRRQSQGGAESITQPETDTMHDAGSRQELGRHNVGDLTSAGPERRRSRRDKKRKSSKDSKKLQRDPKRTYSFSPGRNETLQVTRDQDRPPVPPLPIDIKSKGVRAETEKQDPPPHAGRRPNRASTQPPESTIPDIERMPTLHKRSAQEVGRRKSSKKRKEDHDREAEIKAMVAFMPTRPAAEPYSSGRGMKRENKSMRGGLNRSLQNPSSDISLPLADSIHSSMSGMSDKQASYKLSAFDMLSPRPTIKYSENPRYGPGPSGYGSDRSDSKRKRVSDRIPIPEETLKANKRIEDLADDLTASELRELMERDQKRREKKKIADRIKMERRIARRQEKQAIEEAKAAREGTPPPVNMERGVLGRDVIGLGIGTAAVVSTKRKGSTRSNSEREKQAPEAFRQDSTTESHNPFANFHRSPSLATDNITTPASEHSDPVIEVAKMGTVSRASLSPTSSPRGHTRGASSISQLMDLNKIDDIPQPSAKPESVRQTSQSSLKAPQSWTAFFKRTPKDKRTSTPSSFSNTSRDSMQNGQGPQIGYTPMRSTSNIPKRTMSKFREDLPELPISPPDSRVQSPEADTVPPIRSSYPEKRIAQPASGDEPRIRYDTPTSGYRSLDTMRFRDETPTSGHRSINAPSPEPAVALSQSLASIDSEGSWLSGRRAGSKRGSGQAPIFPLRDSASSLQKRLQEYSESQEELGIAEDEYFSRLSPGPEEENRIRKQSIGNPMPSSDEEDGGSMASPTPSDPSQTKWGAVGRQPTVVHRAPRAKSTEGLLNSFEDDSETERPAGTVKKANRKSHGFSRDVSEEVEPGMHRATSIDLGRGHVRHISAGSARLLELKPKSSADGKRLSSG